MSYVFLNGEMVEESAARVAAGDRGLLLGDGLFESLRAYRGKVFRLAAHLQRLRASAAFLRLTVPCEDAQIEKSVAELVRLNSCAEAYVRITLTRGASAQGLRLDGAGPATLLIHAHPIRLAPAEQYRNGARLIISTARQNTANPLARHKTLSYLLYLLARQEATDANANGAILLNEHGQVAEESVSNVFLARGGALLTPPVYCGLLPGITRGVVLELARAENIAVEERPISAGELFDADELFLTNSLMEIMPVRSVDRRQIGRALPGPITKRVQTLYRAAVEAES
jgi:branched-chain amino acid aminotransferase